MKRTFAKWLEDSWYSDMYLSAWFMPLSMVYVDAIRLRRFLYRKGLLKSTKLTVPVIIVGNITVGGTGKTPLVIWLAQHLKAQGLRPGIISRGYRGMAEAGLERVSAHSDPKLVGDEAVLIARHSGCPIMVGSQRAAAAQKLLAETDCNIIISDDGLQHYALQRDVEIVVIDGLRRFGNGYCLPVGPLREPVERKHQADLVIVNGSNAEEGEFTMQCVGDTLVNLASGEQRPLNSFRGQACHAVAGIGNPQRFFQQLSSAGLTCQTHAFADHHAFAAEDLNFKDSLPVIMTEKDAVKCAGFKSERYWYLPINAQPQQAFIVQLDVLLNKLPAKA